jgi:hypothetical protein
LRKGVWWRFCWRLHWIWCAMSCYDCIMYHNIYCYDLSVKVFSSFLLLEGLSPFQCSFDDSSQEKRHSLTLFAVSADPFLNVSIECRFHVCFMPFVCECHCVFCFSSKDPLSW